MMRAATCQMGRGLYHHDVVVLNSLTKGKKMTSSTPLSYSVPQKTLHWLMAGLIVFNLVFTEGMETYVRALDGGAMPSPDQVGSANIHAYVGISVLCLGLLRLILRLVQGAPAAPENEPAMAKLAAKVAHWSFYALFIMLPLSGIGMYYFGNETAGDVHGGPLKLLMWLLIIAHIAAVLVHQFVWKTGLVSRMTRA